MNFKSALQYLYKNRASDEEFANPFLLYCKLSDLCSSSYEDKQKVLLFYNVNKKINMVEALLRGDDSVAFKYKAVQDLLAESSFKRLLEAVKNVIDPTYMGVKPKSSPPKKAAVQAVVTHVEEQRQEETRTPLDTSYYSGVDWGFIFLIVGIVVVALGVIGAIVAGIVLKSWAVWQWIIGVVGGLALLAAGVFIGYLLDDNIFLDYYIFSPIAHGVVLIANVALFFLFRNDYHVIFCCLSVIITLSGAGFSVFSISDFETGWGICQIAEAVFSAGVMILSFFLFQGLKLRYSYDRIKRVI